MPLIYNNAINADSLIGGGSWTNPDGLTIWYGQQEAALAPGGMFSDPVAGQTVHDYLIALSALITANPTQVSRDPFPVNYQLDKVEVYVESVAASSGTGTFGLGLWDNTAAATLGDTGLIAAMTTAIMTYGSLITVIFAPAGNTAYGNTYAGTLLGGNSLAIAEPFTSGADLPHYLTVTAKAGTAVFQSGVVRVRIFGHHTNATDTNSPGGVD